LSLVAFFSTWKVPMPRISRHVSLSMLRYTVCIAFIPALAGAQGAQLSPVVVSPPIPTLVTAGQGEAKVTPDRATLLINVQTRALTAVEAASENARKTRAVLDALSKLGLPKEQLSTEGYTVYPEMRYDREGGNPRVTGYVVTNMVRAETRRPEQVGTMIDAALSGGANMINSLSFHASSIDEPRRQAIAAAVANARADAEAMARAAGGSLGPLLELSTQGPTIPPRPMYDMAFGRMKMAGAEPTPINAGPQTVTVYLNAGWQFSPGR
jgi:uncharacterized protein YggE